MHCHFMFGINAPTGFETIIDAVIKQLLAPYVTERIHTLVKEFGSSQTVRFSIVRVRIVYDSCRCVEQVERQLGYYHKDRFENHFRVTNKNFTDDQIAAGIAAWERTCVRCHVRFVRLIRNNSSP